VAYSLWDTEPGNQLGVFPSQEDALEAVRQLVAIDTPITWDALALAYQPRGEITDFVLVGDELLAAARDAGSQRTSAA